MERIINKRLTWHLETKSLLDPSQSGFMQHQNTEDQLAYLAQDIENAFQEKKHVLAVFFDLPKAFDKVWKEGLLFKLLEFGVQDKMHTWIQNFLFNCTASVKLDGTISSRVRLREGVPQGGVLTPTLLLVYVNEITAACEDCINKTLHADDLAAWAICKHVSVARKRIQVTINQVEEWANKWFLDVNIAKTAAMLFSLSTKKETIDLHIGTQPIPQVKSTAFHVV
jgi:hypothetical protein